MAQKPSVFAMPAHCAVDSMDAAPHSQSHASHAAEVALSGDKVLAEALHSISLMAGDGESVSHTDGPLSVQDSLQSTERWGSGIPFHVHGGAAPEEVGGCPSRELASAGDMDVDADDVIECHEDSFYASLHNWQSHQKLVDEMGHRRRQPQRQHRDGYSSTTPNTASPTSTLCGVDDAAADGLYAVPIINFSITPQSPLGGSA